jgi:hypothetical protein
MTEFELILRAIAAWHCWAARHAPRISDEEIHP